MTRSSRSSTRSPGPSPRPASRKRRSSPARSIAITSPRTRASPPRCSPTLGSPPMTSERLRNEAIDFVSKTLRGGNDEELGKWTLQLELYKGQPYGHVDRGTVQSLKAITIDDVKEFYRTHYTKAALKLGVAGGADETVLPGLIQGLSSLPAEGSKPPELPSPEIPRGLDVTIVEKPADSTAISLGFPLDVTRRDDDFYALAIANSYLGEHRTFNGKLMQDLRGSCEAQLRRLLLYRGFRSGRDEHVPGSEQSAPPAGVHDLDPPGSRRSCDLRASGGSLGARPAHRARDPARRFRGNPLVPAQLQQTLGADPVEAIGLRHGRCVLRPRGSGHRICTTPPRKSRWSR